MKRINALTIAGTDPQRRGRYPGRSENLLRAGGLWLLGDHRPGGAEYPRRTVGLSHRTGFCGRAARLGVQRCAYRYHQIGMLAETDIVEAVAERLARYRVANVVLDTVMLAKSGDPLLSASAVETLRQRLLPQVSLITPNLPEAAALLDAPHARNEREMLEQGRALLALGCGAVLMKGGHLDDAESPDWLFTREGEQRFTAPRVQTKNTHGTGCTLSAALAALRPRHADWAATVIEAKAWLSAALAQADSLEVGHGIGPVHHFHAWW